MVVIGEIVDCVFYSGIDGDGLDGYVFIVWMVFEDCWVVGCEFGCIVFLIGL